MKNSRTIRQKERSDMPPSIPNLFLAAATGDIPKLLAALTYYDINAIDFESAGMTALHHAAVNLQFGSVDVLLNHPRIDPKISDNFGRTAAWLPVDVLGTNPDAVAMARKLAPFVYAQYCSTPSAANEPK